MTKKVKGKVRSSKSTAKNLSSFSEFLADPPIAAALLVFALIALFLVIIEFGQTLTY